MLVLTRLTGQVTRFTLTPAAMAALAERGEGVDIALQVLRVDGRRVRIGIEGPPLVAVTRDEAKCQDARTAS